MKKVYTRTGDKGTPAFMAERVFPKMIFASRQTAVWTN